MSASATSTQNGQFTPFSIPNFKKLFNFSRARQYMSEMDIRQIHEAIEEKDMVLLEKLYDVLLQEQMTDEEAIRTFVMAKNKILDDLAIKTMSIEKQFIELPRKEATAKIEKKEQKNAEDILKNL